MLLSVLNELYYQDKIDFYSKHLYFLKKHCIRCFPINRNIELEKKCYLYLVTTNCSAVKSAFNIR